MSNLDKLRAKNKAAQEMKAQNQAKKSENLVDDIIQSGISYEEASGDDSQNVNQNLIIPTIMAPFWCQLVLIIVISRLRDLKHRHPAGAFFLALIQDNIAELSKLNCVPNVLKYNPD